MKVYFNLVTLTEGTSAHAKKELELAGLNDEDSDYGGMLADAVQELIDVFAEQGHSGFSAMMCIELFTKLAKQENLTPLTSDPDEWNDVSEMSGQPFWQNKRNSSNFSTDGGKTWYDINVEESLAESLLAGQLCLVG